MAQQPLFKLELGLLKCSSLVRTSFGDASQRLAGTNPCTYHGCSGHLAQEI